MIYVNPQLNNKKVGVGHRLDINPPDVVHELQAAGQREVHPFGQTQEEVHLPREGALGERVGGKHQQIDILSPYLILILFYLKMDWLFIILLILSGSFALATLIFGGIHIRSRSKRMLSLKSRNPTLAHSKN